MKHFKKLTVLAAAALCALAVLAAGCGSDAPAGGKESTQNKVPNAISRPLIISHFCRSARYFRSRHIRPAGYANIAI